MSRRAQRTSDPRKAGLEAVIARHDIARNEGRTRSNGSEYHTPPMRTMCAGCTLSLSAFPNRRAFAAHRSLCEAAVVAS